MTKFSALILKEPYRLFFPFGTFFLLWGAMLWLPLIWGGGDYPVLAHRYLMLNGFVGCFIAGFLMTAVPKFSQTISASAGEVYFFLGLTISGLILAYADEALWVNLFSSMQPLLILCFLFVRMIKRNQNPPYSFLFIFVGLFLWVISGLAGIFIDSEAFKHLHYEGAIASIILGVGSRLIPGILGHVDIVKFQREKYEKPIPIFKTIPFSFLFIVFIFIMSYFLPEKTGQIVRAFDVLFVSLRYWKLWSAPVQKSALTWSIWYASWLVALSFMLKAFAQDGLIHMSHFFFLCGIVLLCLLIATRVLQSHGPKNLILEESKILYFVTLTIFVAGATRVSAFLMPDLYLSHLGYSSLLLSFAVLVWSIKYLRFIFDSNA